MLLETQEFNSNNVLLRISSTSRAVRHGNQTLGKILVENSVLGKKHIKFENGSVAILAQVLFKSLATHRASISRYHFVTMASAGASAAGSVASAAAPAGGVRATSSVQAVAEAARRTVALVGAIAAGTAQVHRTVLPAAMEKISAVRRYLCRTPWPLPR